MADSPVIKFRCLEQEHAQIREAADFFALDNDSAAIRMLLSLGTVKLQEFKRSTEHVTQLLKYAELDRFFSSLQSYTKQQRRAYEIEKAQKMDHPVPQRPAHKQATVSTRPSKAMNLAENTGQSQNHAHGQKYTHDE